MGRTKKGANGSVSGKVGPHVFYKWKDIECVRTLPRVKKNRELSNGEVENRGRFGFTQRFLSLLKPFLRSGFHNYEENRTAFNSAMSYTLLHAVSLDDDGLHIDHDSLRICKGMESLITDVTFRYENGILHCQWEYDKDRVKKSESGNFRSVIALIPDLGKHWPAGQVIGNYLTDKAQSITGKDIEKGATYHVHIGFVSVDHSDRKMDSMYAGTFTT